MQRVLRHTSKRRREGIFPLRFVLALWAALFQIALPLGQGISLEASGLAGLPRTLVICTTQGELRTILLPPGQQAPDGAQDKHAPCVVCLSYGGQGHLALPKLATLPFPPAAFRVTTPPDVLRLTQTPRAESYDARAPPIA